VKNREVSDCPVHSETFKFYSLLFVEKISESVYYSASSFYEINIITKFNKYRSECKYAFISLSPRFSKLPFDIFIEAKDSV